MRQLELADFVPDEAAGMSALAHILMRDLTLLFPGGKRGGTLLPLLFFLAVAVLYPFAVGPDAPLLARTGGGVIWIAALLAAILPLDRLVAPDVEQGFFDQWALRGISEEAVIAVQVLAHWLSFGPPLMLAALPAAGLLRDRRRHVAHRSKWACWRGRPALPRSG